MSLEESMYAAINELVPDAIFSICTGDIVDHTVWNTSKEFNTISSKFDPPVLVPAVFYAP